MGSQMRLTGYHGTKCGYARSIVGSRTYTFSNNDKDWLGSGVYFFISRDKKRAIENARKWAVNFKRFHYYSVLRTEVLTEDDRVIDFNDPDWQDVFHEYKEYKIRDSLKRGLKIEEDVLKFDCATINEICEIKNIAIVIQQRYIKLEKRGDIPLINSNIPNCTIMCVKDKSIIQGDSICVVKEGNAHG